MASRRTIAALLLLAGLGAVAGAEPPPATDARRPLPLLPMMAEHQKANMREHLAAVQAIVAGLAGDDLPAVRAAAARLGTSETMGRMCEHMGAAAPGFTPQALAFHQTADGIAAAAKAGDRDGALRALDRTLQACVGCHAAWRQDVVDQATWERLAREAAAR